MLNIAEIRELNPYQKVASAQRVKRAIPIQLIENGKQQEDLLQQHKKAVQYEVPEGEKTDYEKYVGTLVDMVA